MKSPSVFFPGCVFYLIVKSLILSGCMAAPPVQVCPPDGNINPNLRPPVIANIVVNGRWQRPDSVVMQANEEELFIELQPTQADSHFFKLAVKGLSPCGISSIYPQISYTFLPGGQYQLEYWYQKNGMCSPHQILQIHVKQSIAEQNWFAPAILVSVLLIVAVVALFWILDKTRQSLSLQQIRNRIAADLHDEVSSDLSGIAISMTTLERRRNISPDDFSKSIQDIRQTLSDTQNNLSDTVWAIKPEKDSSDELFQRMRKFVYQMLEPQQIRITFDSTLPHDKTLKITMEQRHTVFKIFKEAVHNIYKHAQATEVKVLIGPHPDGILLEISDNGIGFDLEAERNGSGVNNYFWRAKEQMIELQVDTAPGKGVRLQMLIPQM